MELPITRPSRISYADELDFSELLGELKSKKYNGFIRVTSDSEEGCILFRAGRQVAASYDTYSKVDAIEKIRSATDENNTLIEVFDLKGSQIEYIMNINKAYLINSGFEVNVIDELKKVESDTETEIKPSSDEPETPEIKETVKVELEVQDTPEKGKSENEEDKQEVIAEAAEPKPEKEIQEETEVMTESNDESADSAQEVKAEEVEEAKSMPDAEEANIDITEKPEIKESGNEKIEFEEGKVEAEPIDRAELMKKYGLKDVGEEEVDNILDSYKGGSLSDDDVEKIELTLMNKIKKSILGIPKIKGTEVMVFLDNSASKLIGTINIITEYESKGFLSRIIGESNDLDNLKRQIINITQIEIRKSFREYPEIVDDFEINVEVS